MNIRANRRTVKYTREEKIRRMVWAIALPFFRLSPRPFFGWRRGMLRAFGAVIGPEVHVYSSSVVTMPWNLEVGPYSAIGEHVFLYNLGRVRIGASVTISLRAHICAGTHDYTCATMPLLKPAIAIDDEAWVCADAFIGPGVTIGRGAVVGARAVVVHDVPSWQVVAGNPARFIRERTVSR